MPQRVFVDSNVLFSRTTRDWLFLLRNETRDMYQVHSTVDVVAEVVRAVRRRRPDLDGAVTRLLHDRLIENLDEVLPDYDPSVGFTGRDPGDRHVHAAAVAANADILLTSNTGDFGHPDLLPYEIYRPDEFFVLVDDGAASLVRRVVAKQVAYWEEKRDGKATVKGLVEALVAASCPEFSKRVHRHVLALSGRIGNG